MRSVRMFHQNNVVLSVIGSAQRFPNRNAGMWLAVNVTLSTARNAKLYGKECNPVTRQVCEKVHYQEQCRDVTTEE